MYLECTKNKDKTEKDCTVGLSSNIGIGLMLMVVQFVVQIYLGLICVKFTEEYERENAREIAIQEKMEYKEGMKTLGTALIKHNPDYN